MQLVFTTNYWNHYQASLGQAFAEEFGSDQFRMVLCEPVDEERRHLGWRECGEPPVWLIGPARRPEQWHEYMPLIAGADVAVMGDSPAWMQRQRIRTGKLTFIATERPWKMPLYAWRFLNPRFLLGLQRFRMMVNRPNVHLLSIGAYTAEDYRRVRAFGNSMWSWAYFAEHLACLPEKDVPVHPLRVLWAGRMIGWKRVDVLLRSCSLLRDRSDWHLDLIGAGDKRHRLGLLVEELGLSGRVTFHGPLPPEEVRRMMRQSHVYVLASDRHEGWGVVANEAIAEGCVLVGNEQAGASKVLIRHGHTGYLFGNEDSVGLAEILRYLIENPGLREQIRMRAWRYQMEFWTPQVAARRMGQIVAAQRAGHSWPIHEDGPCVSCSQVLATPRAALRSPREKSG